MMSLRSWIFGGGGGVGGMIICLKNHLEKTKHNQFLQKQQAVVDALFPRVGLLFLTELCDPTKRSAAPSKSRSIFYPFFFYLSAYFVESCGRAHVRLRLSNF